LITQTFTAIGLVPTFVVLSNDETHLNLESLKKMNQELEDEQKAFFSTWVSFKDDSRLDIEHLMQTISDDVKQEHKEILSNFIVQNLFMLKHTRILKAEKKMQDLFPKEYEALQAQIKNN